MGVVFGCENVFSVVRMLLVAMPGAPFVASLLLVVRPGTTNSVLVCLKTIPSVRHWFQVGVPQVLLLKQGSPQAEACITINGSHKAQLKPRNNPQHASKKPIICSIMMLKHLKLMYVYTI